MVDDVNELAKDLPVRCRKCGSNQTHAGKRGLTKSSLWNPLNTPLWKLLRGQTSQVVITCLKCGNTWTPNA